MQGLTSQRYKFQSGLRPVALAGASTLTGITIDLAQNGGIDGVALAIDIGAGNLGDTDPTLTFFQGDEADMSDEEAIPSDRVIGDVPVLDTVNSEYQVGFAPTKRYIRAKVTASANSTAVIALMWALKGTSNPTS